MITFRRKLAIVLLIVLCITTAILTSCGPKQPTDPTDTPSVDLGIDGVYYTVVDGSEYLFTISGNSFMVSGINGDQSGTFTYENGALTLTFANGDSTTASAKLANGVLELTYNGGVYRMLPRTQYTVTFSVDGGSAVPAQKVFNGGFAAKPDDPTKDGYAFIGWYADQAFNTPFAFDSAMISANTTLYARFEPYIAGQVEYTATLMADGATHSQMKTINGILYDLPQLEPKDSVPFAGWFVSDKGSSDALTYLYTDQKLSQDTFLYAVFANTDMPLLSVKSTGVSWNAIGAGVNYRLVIKQGESNVLVDSSVSANEYKYDFTAQPAGEYTVTLTANGKTSTATFLNKALDRPSGFRVVSSNVLVFNPVANAQNYTINVSCGSAGHSHVNINNGKSTNYMFGNCLMPETGIKFTVTASADGYLSSTYTYTLLRTLDQPNVSVNNSAITWTPVENATSYIVELSTDGENYTAHTVSYGTSYDIAGMNRGKLFVKVTPVSVGYYAASTAPVEYEKTTLALPTGIGFSGKNLLWDAVPGAKSYSVKINDTLYEVTNAEIAVPDEVIASAAASFTVSVSAIAEDPLQNSPFSASIVVSRTTIKNVKYENGIVSWDPVFGASKYIVRVGEFEQDVSGSSTSAPIKFYTAGTVEVSVAYVVDDEESTPVAISVNVYTIELDVRGGAAISNNIYKAFGDPIDLPSTTRDGFDFAGWYTTPSGVDSGNAFSSTVFEGSSDMILYAGWTSKKYTVSLDATEEGTLDVSSIEVSYNSLAKAPVPQSANSSKFFAGWYTEKNGAGLCYFDAKGAATQKWNTTKDITLYAHFANVLNFNLIANGKEYSVSKGDLGIGTLTEITIPAYYEGLPVTTIEAGAFQSCSTLEVINIPDTIVNVSVGTDGINNSGSAFQSCSKLAAINIYIAGDDANPDARYFSEDGVLYYNNEFNGVEIKGFPQAKAGVFTIKEGVTTIPAGAFRSSKATTILVPHTVTTIDSRAFYSGTNLTRIEFLATPEGVEPKPLTMTEKAIYSCSKLTEIVLPGRLTEFSADSISSCSALASIDIVGESEKYSAKGEAGRKLLCNKEGTILIFCPKGIEGNVTIPNGISEIGDSAFASCTKLDSITIPGFVTTIGENAFKSCSGLSEIIFEEQGQPLTIKESAFYSCSGLTSLTLPERLVAMEKNAFGATSKLTKVVVNSIGVLDEDGANVLDFASAAFGTNASSPTYYVTSIEVAKDVPTFDITGVFGKKLEFITIHPENPYYSSVDGVLYDKAQTKLLFYPLTKSGAYVLPDTLKEITDSAFDGRTKLTSITIPASVEIIGDRAFFGCSSLTEVIFTPAAEGTTRAALVIGDDAFRSCSALTSIVLPEGTTEVGNQAFMSCSKLVTVTFPASITKLHTDSAGKFMIFSSSIALKSIIIPEANTAYASIDNVVYGKEEGVIKSLLFCPAQKLGSTEVVVPGTVTEVAYRAFYNNKIITSVVFENCTDPDGIEFGEGVFYYCSSITSIKLPVGLKSIPANTFYYCTYLETIEIPYTVESIEQQAFYYARGLREIKFAPTPEGVTPVELVIEDGTSYSNGAFYSLAKLTSIELPERLTTIGSYAFPGSSDSYGNTSSHAIVSVKLPSTLKKINARAFYYAGNLESLTFAPGTKLESIGQYAFYCTSKLASIELPTGASKLTIDDYAFYRSGFESIVIPKNVTQLGSSAFAYSKLENVTFEEGFDGSKLSWTSISSETGIFMATKITSVVLPEGLKYITNNMFQNCTKLESITIPNTVLSIGNYAFSGCADLKSITFETGSNGFSKVNNIGNYALQNTDITTFEFPTLSGTATVKLGDKLFNGCNALQTVKISKSVADLGTAFVGCYSIKAFTIDPDSQHFSMQEGSPVLFNKNKTAYKYIIGYITGDYEIPEGVTEIGVSVFSGQAYITSLKIPHTVQSIGKEAFKSCTGLTSVEFGGSAEHPSQLKLVLATNTHLFYGCTNLKSVVLPEGITCIPNYMFYNCDALTEVTLPGTITDIGNYAFRGTGLRSVTIPAGVKSIGQYAFAGTSSTNVGSLTSVTFEKNAAGTTAVTKFDNYAFQYQSLKSFEVPKTVTTIGGNCFSYNDNLKSLTFEEGTKITKLGASFIAYCSSIESFTIPATVTTLAGSTFRSCEALKTVVIPSNSALTTLGTYEFAASGIETFHFPAKIKTIGTYCFSDCLSLKSVTFDEKSAVTTLSSYFFQDSTVESVTLPASLTKIDTYCFDNSGIQSIVIPAKVTSLGNYSFRNTKALKSVTFADNAALTTFGTYCFDGSGIESIVIPAKVKVLGTSATAATVSSGAYQFRNCESLTKVEFKGPLTLIGGYVFDGCTALTDIKLPETVTQIGNYSFRNTTSLTKLDIPETVKEIGTSTFQGSAITSVTIPSTTAKIGNKAFFQSAIKTVTFESGSSGIVSLGTGVFSECAALTSVTLSDNIEALPADAFEYDRALFEIDLKNVMTIGSAAFNGCSALKRIDLPNTLLSIGGDAFLNCSSLTSITIPKSCESIGNNVFAGCTKLTTYVVEEGSVNFETYQITPNEKALVKKGATNLIIGMPGTVTGALILPDNYMFGPYSFNGISGVTEVVLPKTVTEIPSYAFAYANLKTVTIPESVTFIDSGAFYKSKIETITIPAAVSEIGGSAFRECANLTEVKFAEGSKLEMIGTYLFAASGIKSITLPEGITMLGTTVDISSYTFQDCEALESVTFLGELESLNGSAFKNCKSLKSFTIPETVKYIGTYVFEGSGLESIEIPGNIEALYVSSSSGASGTYNTYTFRDCTSLKKAVFHEGFELLNYGAFDGCTALETVVVPSSMTMIGTYAFRDCTSLKTIEFPEDSKLDTVGNNVFVNSGLVSIVFPKGVTGTGTYVFDGCEKLESVQFLGKIEKLGDYLFRNCVSLKSFTIPTSVETLGTSAFLGSGLTSIVIPSGISAINSSVFKDCVSLETVMVENGVTLLGGSMFSGCTALRSVSLPVSLNNIGASAFDGCTSVKSIVIPNMVSVINNNAFKDWTSSQTIYLVASETSAIGTSNTWMNTCAAKLVWNYVPTED